MKKIVLAIIGFILVILIAYGVFVIVPTMQQSELTSSDMLPSGAIAYVQANDLAKHIKGFSDTEFVKSIKQIDFIAAMKELGASEREINVYRSMAQRFGDPSVGMILSKLFGRELAVGIYPSRILKGATRSQRVMETLSGMYFVTRLSPEVRFIEILTASASKMDSNITEEVYEHQGKTVHVVAVKGGLVKIGYVRFHDMVVFGVGDMAAKRAIEVVNKKEMALNTDAVFQEWMMNQFPGAEQTGYFHYLKFMEAIEPLVVGSGANSQMRAQWDQGLELAQGFKVFALSMRTTPEVLVRLDMMFDPAKLSEKVHKLYMLTPRENKSLAFIPKSVLFYYWNSMLKPDFFVESIRLWQEEKATPQETESSEGAWFGESFGFDFEKTASLLTNDFGWFFADMDFGKIPLPKGVFFMGVNDMAKAGAMIQQRLEDVGFLKLQKETHQGVDIGFIGNIPFFSNFEPSYCLVDNYLLISPHRQTLKQSIDILQGKEVSLKDHDVVRQEKYGFATSGNAAVFIEVTRLAAKVKEVLDWANEWAGIQDSRRQAFKEGAVKRLEDVQGKISSKKTDLTTLEEKLLEFQKEKDAVVEDPEKLSKLESKKSEKQKLLTAMQTALKKALDEESRLNAIKEDETQRLTSSGVNQLEKAAAQVLKRRKRVDELQQEIDAIVEQKSSLENAVDRKEELALAISEKEDLFDEARQKMLALEDTQEELTAIVKEYDNADLPMAEHRLLVLDRIIYPLLGAFDHIPWAGVKTEVLDGRIRSDFLMEVH